MDFKKLVFTGLLGATFAGTAIAQIYESVDAEGNKVFTDEPSIGAEVVNLPQTNTVDAPPDIPVAPPATEAEAPAPAAAPQMEPGETEYVGSGDGDDYDGVYNGEDRRARDAEVIHHNNRVDGSDEGAPGVGMPGPGMGAPGQAERYDAYDSAVPREDLNEVNQGIPHEEMPGHEEMPAHEQVAPREGMEGGARR